LAAILYGLINLSGAMHWERRPIAVHVGAMVAALPLIVVGLWATGGSRSYLRPVLLLAPIHWGFFVRQRRTLVALCAAFILIFWIPQLYQASSHTQSSVANTAGLGLTIVLIAGALSVVRGRLDAAQAKLRALATIDPLTGLLNRRGFATALHALIESAGDGASTYLVLLDLDHLKRLNDTYGHPVGDEALQRFARRLSVASRGRDIVARLGGDEFAVAGHTLDASNVARIAGRLEIAVAGNLGSTSGVRIEATTGWAVAAGHTVDTPSVADSLLHEADQRLILNKRNRCVPATREDRLPRSSAAPLEAALACVGS
jgi:diguanylate cyclase (GGDEF)-like protein